MVIKMTLKYEVKCSFLKQGVVSLKNGYNFIKIYLVIRKDAKSL